MAATVRSVSTAVENDGTISVAQPTGQADGDVLIACGFGYELTVPNITLPAGFTERDNETSGGSNRHGKIATKVASGESWPKTFGNGTAADYFAVIMVAVQGADTSSADGVDGTATSGVASGADDTVDAPSVTVTGSDSLLLSFAMGNSFSASTYTVTSPSGMTEIADFRRPDNFDTYAAASLALSSSGATGVKTFTFSTGATNAGGWMTFSIAIRSAVVGGLGPGLLRSMAGDQLVAMDGTRLVPMAGGTALGFPIPRRRPALTFR